MSADETEALRRRVAELERLLAQAQERTYWLDRLGVDLDAVMSRPLVWAAFRAAGRTRHALRTIRRRAR